MKQNLKGSLLGLITATFFATTSFGQYNETASIVKTDKMLAAAKALISGEEADGLALSKLKTVSEKAFKDFSKFYANATDIRIHNSGSNTLIVCNIDGAAARIQYNAKGRWLHTVKTYSPRLLPANVKSIVEEAYPAFRLFGVTEVSVGNKTAHLVSIENDKSWKRIKVVDGEFEVYEAYNK